VTRQAQTHSRLFLIAATSLLLCSFLSAMSAASGADVKLPLTLDTKARHIGDKGSEPTTPVTPLPALDEERLLKWQIELGAALDNELRLPPDEVDVTRVRELCRTYLAKRIGNNLGSGFDLLLLRFLSLLPLHLPDVAQFQ
jgi:hypothetical protein